MHSIHPEPRRKAAVAYNTFRLMIKVVRSIFSPARFFLVALLLAFARGLGGARYESEPAPRNLPAEVERKR
jgi:hypothetical protein